MKHEHKKSSKIGEKNTKEDALNNLAYERKKKIEKEAKSQHGALQKKKDEEERQILAT